MSHHQEDRLLGRNTQRKRKMKLHTEKIKCVLTAILDKPTFADVLKEVFRTAETKNSASPFPHWPTFFLPPFLHVEPHPREGEGDRPSA